MGSNEGAMNNLRRTSLYSLKTKKIRKIKIEPKAEEDKPQNNELICNTHGKDKGYYPQGEEPLSLKTIVQIVYVCQALSYFFGITAVVGVIINYLRLDEARGTWLESHFVWQIRTFWISLAAAIIGCVFIFIGIGFLILAANLVWIIYRVIKGWLLLQKGQPVANCTTLL
jgi:uncharacterized membrane protein